MKVRGRPEVFFSEGFSGRGAESRLIPSMTYTRNLHVPRKVSVLAVWVAHNERGLWPGAPANPL
jgi:hypothetical protein